MTDREKKKVTSKSLKKRKSVSTFSKMMEDQIENQKKQIQALFGSPNRLFDHLEIISKIEKDKRLLGFPSEQDLEEIRRQAENLPAGNEELNRIRESIPDYLLNELENSRAIIESQWMFESLIGFNINDIKQLEGMLINLQVNDIQRTLDEFSTLNISVNEYKPIKPLNNEYLLNSTTSKNIDLGNIKFKTTQQTQLQVQTLQAKVEEIHKNLLEDAKKKDETIKELYDYIKKSGSNIVKVKKVRYNKKSTELIIDKKSISIKADTNQHYLCHILLTSNKNIQKVWEVYDIVEAMGEDPEILEGWPNKIYNTVRHLNLKIQSKTGFDNFLIYDNKTVRVNPKYIDLS